MGMRFLELIALVAFTGLILTHSDGFAQVVTASGRNYVGFVQGLQGKGSIFG